MHYLVWGLVVQKSFTISSSLCMNIKMSNIVQNDSYDSYQSVSMSIISGVGPTSLQLGLFIHQTRHRTRMQARDELSCMHRVGRRPSHRATSHHIALNITGLDIKTLLYS